MLKGIGALLIVALVVGAAVLGARQVWFVGTDSSEELALFRGLPYELPFGIELYSEQESSGVPLQSLPVERREVATNHELRSQDDARSLLEDLENTAVTTTGPNDKGGNGGGGAGGNRSGGGGGGSSGGGGSPSGGGNG